MYYLRTRAAADAIKFTVDQQALARSKAAKPAIAPKPVLGTPGIAAALAAGGETPPTAGELWDRVPGIAYPSSKAKPICESAAELGHTREASLKQDLESILPVATLVEMYGGYACMRCVKLCMSLVADMALVCCVLTGKKTVAKMDVDSIIAQERNMAAMVCSLTNKDDCMMCGS